MDPENGRFLSMDSYGGNLSNPISQNRYLFANSNPVKYRDPSGHTNLTEQLLAIGIAGIIGAEIEASIYTWVSYFQLEQGNVRTSQYFWSGFIFSAIHGFVCGGLFADIGILAGIVMNLLDLSILSRLVVGLVASVVSLGTEVLSIYYAEQGNSDTARVLGYISAGTAAIAFAGLFSAIRMNIVNNASSNSSNQGVNEGGGNTASPYELETTHSQTKSNRQMIEFIEQIKSDGGINEPIKYVEYNGIKYVVDGHHRLLAAKVLNLSEVPIEEVD